MRNSDNEAKDMWNITIKEIGKITHENSSNLSFEYLKIFFTELDE